MELFELIAITTLVGVFIATLISFFRNDLLGPVRIQSLTIAQINTLRASAHDANAFIKEYYDFKHKNISTYLKGTASVFLICAGSLVKITFEDQKFQLKGEHILLLVLSSLLILINTLIASELNRCNTEYATAVMEYEN